MARSSLLFLFFTSFCFGQIHPESEIDSLLRIGIEKIILQDYSSAENIFKTLDNEYPKIPLGNIYLAANQITRTVDYAEELNNDYVDSLLQSALNKIELLRNENDEDIWNNYYEALVHGYKAYYHSISGNIISAFADGVLSLRSFQECLEMDNDFYEYPGREIEFE